MKLISLAFLLGLYCITLPAQVAVMSQPEAGFEERIRDYVDNMRIVDSHEHQLNPTYYKNNRMYDFTLLFHHYSDDDIRSGGMSEKMFNRLLTDSLSVMQKWEIFKPYWKNASNTAYNRAAMLTIRNLYGIEELNDQTVVALSDKIRDAYQSPVEWYIHVMKDKCKINYVVNDMSENNFGDPSMMRHVTRFDSYINISSWGRIESLSKAKKATINTLDDYVAIFHQDFDHAMKSKMVAVKTGLAYDRPLLYEDVSKERAEVVFNKLKNSKQGDVFGFDEVKPLQDYMMHVVIAAAGKAKLPMQIHTGLQAGNENHITWTNPTLLGNLFQKYPDVKFLIMHGSYPYGGELATLGKNFPNVYLDLCWLHIISPSYSERYLNEWVETVPVNKIIGFGGDFRYPEGTFGHQLFARQIIANVLVKKVHDGYFSEKEAIKYAQMILHDNAIEIMKLDQ